MTRTLAISVALLFATACSASPAPRPRAANRPRPVVQRVPPVASTVPATGDLRDVVLTLRRVHFPLDGYALGADSRDALAHAASLLRSHTDVAVYVQGNADERGTTEYNLGLGERRARAVTSYLARLGVNESQLALVSFGEERPLDARHDPDAWATNRRVDFVLLRGDAQIVLEEGTRLSDRGTRIQ